MDTLYTIKIEIEKAGHTYIETLDDVTRVVDGDRYMAVFIEDGSQRWYSHSHVISVKIREQ